MSTNRQHNAVGEDRAVLGPQMQDNLGESSVYVRSPSHTIRSGSGIRLRRKLQQALALVAILMMLTAFTPHEASAFESNSYSASYWRCTRHCNGGGGGGGSTGTVANHNETLVEDEE